MNVIVLDNKNLEHKLTLDKQYEVKGETTGDFYDYYLLLCDDGSKHWVEKYRVAESKSRRILEEMGLLSAEKLPIERIICIPDESGHIVDLQRVQYISPLEDGSYKVTLVSGWEMKLTEEVYSREKLIGLWRGLQNKQA